MFYLCICISSYLSISLFQTSCFLTHLYCHATVWCGFHCYYLFIFFICLPIHLHLSLVYPYFIFLILILLNLLCSWTPRLVYHMCNPPSTCLSTHFSTHFFLPEYLLYTWSGLQCNLYLHSITSKELHISCDLRVLCLSTCLSIYLSIHFFLSNICFLNDQDSSVIYIRILLHPGNSIYRVAYVYSVYLHAYLSTSSFTSFYLNTCFLND